MIWIVVGSKFFLDWRHNVKSTKTWLCVRRTKIWINKTSKAKAHSSSNRELSFKCVRENFLSSTDVNFSFSFEKTGFLHVLRGVEWQRGWNESMENENFIHTWARGETSIANTNMKSIKASEIAFCISIGFQLSVLLEFTTVQKKNSIWWK